MSKFAFLPPTFKELAESSRKAEEHIMGDPPAACFHEPGGAAQEANGKNQLVSQKKMPIFLTGDTP